MQGQKFSAKLTGQDEVPPNDSKATGSFEMELSRDGKISHYALHVKNIRNVLSAQMHEGKKGANGPVVETLYNSATPISMVDGTLSKGKVFSNLFEGPLAGKYIPDLIKLIDDGKAYVSIYTKENPQGEIRGQLSNATSTSPYFAT